MGSSYPCFPIKTGIMGRVVLTGPQFLEQREYLSGRDFSGLSTAATRQESSTNTANFSHRSGISDHLHGLPYQLFLGSHVAKSHKKEMTEEEASLMDVDSLE